MKIYTVVLSLVVIIAITSCGGGGGGTDNAAATYAISGTVISAGTGTALQDVTMSLISSSVLDTTSTSTNGTYSFNGLPNGNYTVVPAKTGYALSPISIAVAVSSANITGKNFTATVNSSPTYTISGTVSGAVAKDVKLTLSGANTGSVLTTTSGAYAIAGLLDGSYTVTPSRTGYMFTPSNRTVTISGGNSTVATFVSSVAPTPASQWTITTVDSSADVGSWPAMAVSANGLVHITYRDVTNKVLKYARGNEGTWTFANLGPIDSTTAGVVTGISSIALDGQDNPHVSFHRPDYAFYYTKWTGSAWTTPAAIPSAATSWAFLPQNTIAVDKNSGVAHVVFPDEQPPYYCPRLSYWNTTLGAAQNIESTCVNYTSVGDRNAVAVDGNGGVHIVYYKGDDAAATPYVLKYSGPGGVSGVVDASSYFTPGNGMTEYRPSLVIDSANRPRVVYVNSSGVRYAADNVSSVLLT